MNMIPSPNISQSSQADGTATAAALLAALKAAHRNLEDAIAALDQVVGATAPDAAALSSARFQLSRASLARRHASQRARDNLVAQTGPAEIGTIRSLQQADFEYVRDSTAHVQRWSTAAALADWSGFREASRAMRAKMRDAIGFERRLLLPLLTGRADR